MPLKKYQQDTLDQLRAFTEELSQTNARLDTAFTKHQFRQDKRIAIYHPVSGLENVPFVCLKVPTGGGKTLLAAASIPILATMLSTRRPVVVWLVPTKAILNQTLRTLRNSRSLARLEMGQGLPDPTVLSVAEALKTGVAAYGGGPVIIVATLAAFNISDKEGRKVYSSSGDLIDHFENPNINLDEFLVREPDGTMPFSLCNVLRLHRPILIIDEAHKARTLSAFNTLSRFAPSFALEFTATPTELEKKPNREKPPSNVLVDVPAYRLKAEETIKAPIRLEAVPEWEDCLRMALNKRDDLEPKAKEWMLPNPVVLIQCDPINGMLPLGTVESKLHEIGIHHDWINVNDPPMDIARTEIRIILTVDKLKEGWDCPQAYVLCALRDLNSKTAVTQTLGRVMRQPNVRHYPDPDLNRAYVYSIGDRFNTKAAAETIVHALENLGFDRWTATNTVETDHPTLPMSWDENLFAPEGFEAVARGAKLCDFSIPQLTFEFEGKREPATNEHFIGDVSIRSMSTAIEDYDPKAGSGMAEIDISTTSRMTYNLVALSRQLELLHSDKTLTPSQIVTWFDRQIRFTELQSRDSYVWIMRALENLVKNGTDWDHIWRDRVRLRTALAHQMKKLLTEAFQSRANGFLFDPPDEGLIVDENYVLRLPDRYDVPKIYEGHGLDRKSVV